MSERRESHPGDPGLASTRLNTVAMVVSSDDVWAKLLSLNLSARGVSTVEFPLAGGGNDEGPAHAATWLIVDSETDSQSWRSLVDASKDLHLAIAVDSEMGSVDFAGVEPDAVIEKSADMRIMTRDLLAAIEASPIDRHLIGLIPRW